MFQDFDKRKISMYHISPKLIKNPQQKNLKTNKVFSYYNWPVTSPKFPLWKTLTLSMVLSKNISYRPMPCSSQHQHLDLLYSYTFRYTYPFLIFIPIYYNSSIISDVFHYNSRGLAFFDLSFGFTSLCDLSMSSDLIF